MHGRAEFLRWDSLSHFNSIDWQCDSVADMESATGLMRQISRYGMAQANVAREPSMEEILASIRKIIESNDVTEDHESASKEVDSDDLGPSTEPAPQPVSLLNRIPGDGAELAAPKSRGLLATESRVEPLAPLRAGLEPTVEKTPASEEADMDQTHPVEARREAPARLADVAAAARREPSGNQQPSDDQAHSKRPETIASDESDVVLLPDTDPDIDADGSEDERDAQQAGAEEEATVKEPRALISPAVGARVAASFGDLSHAVSNGPTRSFDAIAEDMLRPMLQQWMDDNLPTLVERLVREEIERVARGR